MQYDHVSIERSAEYLRQALPLMSRQAAALHPISYAIWYEYVAGNNPSLRASINEHTQDGAVLDERTTHELFRRHVAELDEKTVRALSSKFQEIMADVSLSTCEVGEQASEFGSALQLWSDGVAEAGLRAEDEITGLMEHARTTQASIFSLQECLHESRCEIERLREEVSRAREEALLDGLTGLTNRKGFDQALSSCLAEPAAHEQGLSLVMADIDFFKQVNDNFGHLFGDRVLQAVAQLIRSNVKGQDTAARYGGEEFVILLPETPLEGARHLAEKIRASVEKCRVKRASTREVIAKVTISLGVAEYRLGESENEFVARADAALFASKNNGRNLVSISEP